MRKVFGGTSKYWLISAVIWMGIAVFDIAMIPTKDDLSFSNSRVFWAVFALLVSMAWFVCFWKARRSDPT